MIALPAEWPVKFIPAAMKVKHYNGLRLTAIDISGKAQSDCWFIISNARYAVSVDCQWFAQIVDNLDYDLIAVNVDNSLVSYREKALITSAHRLAGFRRLYSDCVLPAELGADWPAHIFIRFSALKKLLTDDSLTLNYAEFVNRCRKASLKAYCFTIAGTVNDLETEPGLLNFLMTELGTIRSYTHIRHPNTEHCKISAGARIFGKVLLGEGVELGDKTIIIGPAILGDNVKAAAATIKESVIAPAVVLPNGCLMRNRIITSQFPKKRAYEHAETAAALYMHLTSAKSSGIDNNFRTWPFFSYPRAVKRTADIAVSLVMLVLFAPAFPIIAVVIKLSSPGPVFFRHRREGLHAGKFSCLKFRTMVEGADQIQQKLRFKNEVDGPQFKVENDPRVTPVGGFLRDTFIDEIPQFVNILLGQMSLVGPRPSPKAENLFCPLWRYARLSVRPGITGLWQICRTRRPNRDFQEWIYYDTNYVRNLSLGLDLLICGRTVKKLFLNFIRKF